MPIPGNAIACFDALGAEEPVVVRDFDEASAALSPDGRWLAIQQYARETMDDDIAVFDLQQGSEPVPVAKTPFTERSPHFSRDSAWLAYLSNASGRSEIYVQRVADAAGRVKVSSNGGSTPRWSPVDDEIYYLAGDTIMALGYRVVGGEFRAETLRALVKPPEGNLTSATTSWTENGFEVSPDGKRVLARCVDGRRSFTDGAPRQDELVRGAEAPRSDR